MKNAEWMLRNNMRIADLEWSYIAGANVISYHGTVLHRDYGEPSENRLKWLEKEHDDELDR